jgi:hypothetical protein
MIRTLIDWAPRRELPRAAGRNVRSRAYSIHYSLRPLVVAGILSLLAWLGVYVLFFSHSLWEGPSLIPDRWPYFFYPIENSLPWAWVHAPRDSPMGWMNMALWVVLAAALFALWLWALRTTAAVPGGNPRLAPTGIRIVLLGLGAFSLLLVFSPGLTSQDLYSNIWYSKMAGVYGVSPFTHAPIDFMHADFQNWLQWVYWKDQACVYGPAWVLPAAALGWLAQHIDGDIVTYVLVQRGATALLHLANTVLIWHLAGKLWPLSPGRRLAATIFYGWCPLVVWEFANNAHNDVLLVFWMLVALWCHFKGVERQDRRPAAGLGAWWWGAVAALTLAGLTKLTGFLLLPAYVFLLWRTVGEMNRWRRRAAIAVQATGLAFGLTVLLYLPYWDGLGTLRTLLQAPGNREYANSLGLMVRFWLPGLLQAGADLLQFGPLARWAATLSAFLDAWLRPVLLGLAALAAAICAWRARDLRSLLHSWGWTWVAYLLIGAVWIWPWYATWVIPLAALAGPSRLRSLLVVSVAVGMIFYVR